MRRPRMADSTSPAFGLGPALRVRAKITSDFGGSAAGSDARRVGGSVSSAILDRPCNNADDPAPPRPGGLRGFGTLASLLLSQRPLRVSSLVEPRQRAKSSAAKSEFIFARTLSPSKAQRTLRAIQRLGVHCVLNSSHSPVTGFRRPVDGFRPPVSNPPPVSLLSPFLSRLRNSNGVLLSNSWQSGHINSFTPLSTHGSREFQSAPPLLERIPSIP